MKATDKDGNLKKVAYRLPPELCEKLEKSAIENRRSINDELITIIEDFIDIPIKWEPGIMKAIKELAKKQGWSVSYTVNFLLGMKLSDIDIKIDNSSNDTSKTA